MIWGTMVVAGCSAAPLRVQGSSAVIQPHPPHATLYFRFDRRTLAPAEQPKAAADADWLAGRERTVLLLEGHADAVGSEEYNVQLGDARARSVAAALMARGVPADRIAGIISHGERLPAARGRGAAARARNRRVELTAW